MFHRGKVQPSEETRQIHRLSGYASSKRGEIRGEREKDREREEEYTISVIV